jgi:hypothetical protein
MSAPEGWYADPSDASGERWWDGVAWAAHTRPLSIPDPVAAPELTTDPAPVIALDPLPVLEPLATYEPLPALEPLPAFEPAFDAVPGLEPVAGFAAVPVLEPLPALEPLLVGAGAPYTGGAAGAAQHPIAHPSVTPQPVVAAPVTYVAPPTVDPEAFTPSSSHLVGAGAVGHAPAVDSFNLGGASSAGGYSGSTFGGGSFGGGGGGQFGGAGQVTRLGASSNGWTPELNGAATALSVRRGPKLTTVLLVTLVVAALGAVAYFVVLPRYRDQQAIATASSTESVLPHVAPRTLAGERRATVPGLNTAALAKGFTDDGAAWAWTSAYRGKTFTSFYLASALPTSSQPDAVRALTSPEAAATLLGEVSQGLLQASGGNVSAGKATEYDDKVVGKTWCVPVSARGQGGGMCLWTSGKEMLAVMMLPGNEVSTAKRTLKALLEMKALTATVGARAATK